MMTTEHPTSLLRCRVVVQELTDFALSEVDVRDRTRMPCRMSRSGHPDLLPRQTTVLKQEP